MEAHGYVLKGRPSNLPNDYVPSLIGVKATDPSQSIYFERIDIEDRTVTDITVSPFVCYDNGDAEVNDLILTVKGPATGYYIPISELREIAAAHQDDDLWAMLDSIAARFA